MYLRSRLLSEVCHVQILNGKIAQNLSHSFSNENDKLCSSHKLQNTLKHEEDSVKFKLSECLYVEMYIGIQRYLFNLFTCRRNYFLKINVVVVVVVGISPIVRLWDLGL